VKSGLTALVCSFVFDGAGNSWASAFGEGKSNQQQSKDKEVKEEADLRWICYSWKIET
jgi:hypothetical protein